MLRHTLTSHLWTCTNTGLKFYYIINYNHMQCALYIMASLKQWYYCYTKIRYDNNIVYTTNKSICWIIYAIYIVGFTLKVLTLFPTPAGTRTIWCRTGCGIVDTEIGCLAPPCVSQIGTSLSRLLALPYCNGHDIFKLDSKH